LAQELAVLDLVLSTELMTAGSDKGQIGTAVARARKMTRDLRHVCFGLFPASLEAMGLTGAVEELLEYCRLTGIEAQLIADDRMHGRRLTAQAEETLLRIIQEGVSNASRHGQASQIEVVLRISGEHLVVEVRDNGTGFDVKAQAAGLGLRSMAQRAESLNGVMEIKSDQGTAIRLIVPMGQIDTAATGTAQTG
jgi:signal transduction histidine kinase